ncbi:16S rRNA (uracil(1498)-N(3))-methyltransferase [Halovulum dunhuangense]|uniref:Ribosomal RNA small subunit methyltransferase E n=1 Tax=Halovulum dunhuangense TaxID=1505036 RepID=A0A849KZU6_9RHOB|nr:16S rRNA (uracil(1498)-N(3))-methyltransferase [Halovulum dunhuangense]NNU79674.1 16S rRNA (uracil(1498)-N(3))-methyltransferase [Halovulum dunhuangense]
MTENSPKIRLFLDAALSVGQMVELTPAQTHYLGGVMRRAAGHEVAVFNGRDGEWRAVIEVMEKKRARLRILEQTAPQLGPPDLWLMFAPIKKARTDFIVEKATELGCARIQPVLTRFTNAERVRVDRLQAHAVEAAEQCGGTFVPEVAEPVRLDRLLGDWPADRRLMFCDEARTALPVAEALAGAGGGPWAILVGPEGGFASDEAARLRAIPGVVPVTLGPRILRADTAAAAAITAWQMQLGDWT